MEPLAAAVNRNHHNIVDILLEQPNIDINTVDHGGNTTLAAALEGGYEDMIRLLLEHPKIDMNVVNFF